MKPELPPQSNVLWAPPELNKTTGFTVNMVKIVVYDDAVQFFYRLDAVYMMEYVATHYFNLLFLLVVSVDIGLANS